MENYGLDQKINGVSVVEYISQQLEAIERKDIELEKEKIKNSYLKQLNNHSRLQLDTAKFALKKAEFELAQKA